jgi:hypothetical protein
MVVGLEQAGRLAALVQRVLSSLKNITVIKAA